MSAKKTPPAKSTAKPAAAAPAKEVKRRGKKVGSSDVMNLRFGLLKELIPNDETVLPVRRKWVEAYCKLTGISIDRFENPLAKPRRVGAESDPAESEVRERVIFEEEEL